MSATRTCPACGNSGTYASGALADVHHRRHSCAKHRQAMERARRRVQHARGRVRQDCTHPHARHKHGTRVAYVKDLCRCTDCTAANTAAGRAVHRAQTFDRWQPFVDAAPVREHICALRAAGIGVERIAVLARISTSHVRELANPGRVGNPGVQRVRPATADRVLRVRIDQANRAPRSHVDATGTRSPPAGPRRRRMAPRHARRSTRQKLRWPPPQHVQPLRHRADRAGRHGPLRTALGPAAAAVHRCRARCRRRCPGPGRGPGLAAPMAWDDIDTDPDPRHHTQRADTEGHLDEIAIERALAGDGVRLEHLTSAEQDEVVRRLTIRVKSISDIAQQLATTKRTVSRRRAAINAA